MLPLNVNDEELARFKNVSTVKKDKTYLDSLYPEETWATDTFATRTGDQWFWMNSSENTDIYQSSVLKPQINKSGYFYIGAGPHTYATIQESKEGFKGLIGNYRINMDGIYTEDNQLEFDEMNDDINNFIYNNLMFGKQDDKTLRQTDIRVSGTYHDGKPELIIKSEGVNVNDFTYRESWDEKSNLYKLTIMHNGPVEFELKVDDSSSILPETPSGLKAEPIDGASVDLKWNEVGSAFAYEVEANGIIYNVIRPQIISQLKADTFYTFKVRAKNAAGVSPWSNAVTVKTQMRYEAEKADTNAKTGSSGNASNQGIVGGMDDEGKYVTFMVEVPETRTYKVNIAYAAGSGMAKRSIYRNDIFVEEQSFDATSGWGNFKVLQIYMDLNAGNNAIMIKTDANQPNTIDLDYLEVLLDNVTVIDLTALKSVYMYANQIDRSKYTPESLQGLDKELGNADKLLNQDLGSVLQEEADKAIIALSTALNNLKEKEIAPVKYADVSALKAILGKVGALDRSKYTQVSLNNLDNTINTGQALLKINPKAELQDVIGTVTGAIQNAMISLVTKPVPKPQIPEKGSTVRIGRYEYKVTKSAVKNGTVELLKPTKKTYKNAVIPSAIKINKNTFAVTSVSDKAFKNNKKLRSIIIGSNIKTIGKECFYGCSKLKAITVKSSKLKKIGRNSLKYIYKKAFIKVPSKKISGYKKLFKNKGQKDTVVIKKS